MISDKFKSAILPIVLDSKSSILIPQRRRGRSRDLFSGFKERRKMRKKLKKVLTKLDKENLSFETMESPF